MYLVTPSSVPGPTGHSRPAHGSALTEKIEIIVSKFGSRGPNETTGSAPAAPTRPRDPTQTFLHKNSTVSMRFIVSPKQRDPISQRQQDRGNDSRGLNETVGPDPAAQHVLHDLSMYLVTPSSVPPVVQPGIPFTHNGPPLSPTQISITKN
jgi:hypothetical protein